MRNLLKKHLFFAKKENLTVLSFETVESDVLFEYIKTQIPVFEKDYGKIMSVEGVLKAPFKPRVSNYIFEDEIGYVVDEYVRLLPFWFQSLYGFTGQYTLHQKYEHSNGDTQFRENFAILFLQIRMKVFLVGR